MALNENFEYLSVFPAACVVGESEEFLVWMQQRTILRTWHRSNRRFCVFQRGAAHQPRGTHAHHESYFNHEIWLPMMPTTRGSLWTLNTAQLFQTAQQRSISSGEESLPPPPPTHTYTHTILTMALRAS